jgi:hypothetical protein
MVTRKSGPSIRAGRTTLERGKGTKQHLSGRTKRVMRASEGSTLIIKETVRLYGSALRRLADR